MGALNARAARVALAPLVCAAQGVASVEGCGGHVENHGARTPPRRLLGSCSRGALPAAAVGGARCGRPRAVAPSRRGVWPAHRRRSRRLDGGRRCLPRPLSHGSPRRGGALPAAALRFMAAVARGGRVPRSLHALRRALRVLLPLQGPPRNAPHSAASLRAWRRPTVRSSRRRSLALCGCRARAARLACERSCTSGRRGAKARRVAPRPRARARQVRHPRPAETWPRSGAVARVGGGHARSLAAVGQPSPVARGGVRHFLPCLRRQPARAPRSRLPQPASGLCPGGSRRGRDAGGGDAAATRMLRTILRGDGRCCCTPQPARHSSGVRGEARHRPAPGTPKGVRPPPGGAAASVCLARSRARGGSALALPPPRRRMAPLDVGAARPLSRSCRCCRGGGGARRSGGACGGGGGGAPSRRRGVGGTAGVGRCGTGGGRAGGSSPGGRGARCGGRGRAREAEGGGRRATRRRGGGGAGGGGEGSFTRGGRGGHGCQARGRGCGAEAGREARGGGSPGEAGGGT